MRNILVVDDDVDFADASSEQMRAARYTVESIADREKAIAACLSDGRPFTADAIIVDLYMPRQDEIREIATLPQAGVINPISAITCGGSIRFTKMPEVARAPEASTSLAKLFPASALPGLLVKYTPREPAS